MIKTSPLRAVIYAVMAAVMIAVGLEYGISPVETAFIALVSAFAAEVVVPGDE